MYPAICDLKSAMQMNFFRMFLGMMYVYPASCKPRANVSSNSLYHGKVNGNKG